MVYAIRVREICQETFLVEADDLSEAISKAEEFNNEVGFDLSDNVFWEIDESPYAGRNGEATEEQLKYCEKLEV